MHIIISSYFINIKCRINYFAFKKYYKFLFIYSDLKNKLKNFGRIKYFELNGK